MKKYQLQRSIGDTIQIGEREKKSRLIQGILHSDQFCIFDWGNEEDGFQSASGIRKWIIQQYIAVANLRIDFEIGGMLENQSAKFPLFGYSTYRSS